MRIVVEPSVLLQYASQMEEKIRAYEKQYQTLYQQIDAMSSSWQGKDNQAYVMQIQGFKKDFQQMVFMLTQYVEFLRTSAKMYQETQDERMMQARKLAG